MDSSTDKGKEEPHRDVQLSKRYSKTAPKGKKRHASDQCNGAFDQRSKLLVHIENVYEPIRPHACQQCDKRYIRAYDLQVHNRTHTGLIQV